MWQFLQQCAAGLLNGRLVLLLAEYFLGPCFKALDICIINNILFIENLSSQISEPMLKNLFAQYLGFREVRILSGKGIAFIEYDNEINAGTALVGKDISYIGLNGLQLTPDCVLQISFAKK